MNVVEDVTTVEGKEQIKKIGKLVDEPGGTATQVPKKVIKKIGKLVPEDKKTASGTKVQDSGERFAIQNIVGDSGTNYGIGVYLDSTLLSGLTEDERIEMVKEYVKELGGKAFTAYDSKNRAVSVYIAESNQKFRNKKGKNVPVNKDLTSFLDKDIKQEAIALVDELIISSKYDSKKPANYSHGWLDNHGKNDWEYWETYIQDKENTIWKATLNIVTSQNGDKILYDIFPIEKVEQSVTSDTSTTTHIIPNSSQNVNTSGKNSSKDFDSGERSALADGKRATAGEVAAVKSSISKRGIDPKGIIAIADKYFARYSGQLTRTGVRYEFLAAADMLFDLTAESGDRAYASVEALAEELVTNAKDKKPPIVSLYYKRSFLFDCEF